MSAKYPKAKPADLANALILAYFCVAAATNADGTESALPVGRTISSLLHQQRLAPLGMV